MRTIDYETSPGALQAFMIGAQQAWRPSLYTFTLNGGQVLRWTSADKAVLVGSTTYALGPKISDQGVKTKRGTEAGTCGIDVLADASDLINGVGFMHFVEQGGFEGARCEIRRAFAPDPNTPIVGTFLAFGGRFSEVQDLMETSCTLVIADWRELLVQNVGPFVYQPSCRHVLGDAGCALDLETLKVAGHVNSGTRTTTSFPTNLGAAAGTYDLGKLKFTSGVNNGLVRTIKTQDGAGNLTFAFGFPAAPSPADTFYAYPGCDLTMATCEAKFSNLSHFGGEPFCPVPETPY